MKHLHLIYRLLLLSAAAAGLQALWDLYQQAWTIVLLDLFILIWMLAVAFIIKNVKILLVRYACLLSVGFILLVTGSVIPEQNGLHLLFLPLLGAIFILFDYKEHWAKLLSGAFVLSCYLLLEASNFKLFGELPMLEEPDRVSYILNFVTASVLLFLIISFVTQNSYRANKRLQKMAEETQERNLELTRANEELDRFVYSTSHDLRSPLHSLAGLVKLVERTATTDVLQPYLSMMHDRIQHLEGFITELTQYARNSRMPLKLSIVDLPGLIEEVLNNHRYLHAESNIELRQYTTVGAKVVSDPQRLLTILNNLVSNALKYHKLNQENPYVAVGAKLTGNQLYLWVEDNGPGIAPEVRARMFDMFYQGDERATGSGLGLYIVKETVEKFGGRIEADSETGCGSVFKVWIPLSKETDNLWANPQSETLQEA